MQDTYFLNTSVTKAFSIMEHLCAYGELGVSEISKSLKINKSSTHRIIATLQYLGYVQQKSQKGKYCPTLKLLTVASQTATVLRIMRIVHAFLEDLSKTFRETANLAVLENGEVVYIDKVESSETLRIDLSVGRRVPAHCTALGKVFLAHLPPDELKEILSKDLAKYTKKTITIIRDLKKEIEIIRRNGYAIDDEELNLGIRCIGAPIYDRHNRVIAAISIAGPSVRLSLKKIHLLVNPIKYAADAISKELGSNL